jgi:hypothetical protein
VSRASGIGLRREDGIPIRVRIAPVFAADSTIDIEPVSEVDSDVRIHPSLSLAILDQ